MGDVFDGVDDSFAREYRRIVRKVDTIKGLGVSNTPESISINPPGQVNARRARKPNDDGVGFYPVLVKRNGGSAGTKTTDCTFTYDLYDLSDTTYTTKLNTEDPLAPECSRSRILQAPMTAAPDGSVASAYDDDDGVIHLFDLQEKISQVNCS